MSYFLQQLINGIQLGFVYALIALGYTMVYGIVRLINFAHGDVFMVGAYLGFFALTSWHLPFPVAIILAMVGCALLGVFIERVAYKPLRRAARISALITAIGVSLFLEYFSSLKFVFGPYFRAYPRPFPIRTFTIAGITISNIQIIVLAVAILLMIALTIFVNRTKTGLAMRAVSFDHDTARLMGIDVDNIISITFGIGAALAGAGGVLYGIAYPQIHPFMGIMPGLKAFIAAVLGGIGIIPGALLGAIIMGIVEKLTEVYISSTLRDAAAFGILILVLLIRPSGILGKKRDEKV
ncbi:MAG: branched-chain amino acid ABC transporter permease [candidate division WOR-3 bacterium]|uniref:Branched-chain amino acid ABC transporter permease n=1 Tax=candidate division WOR-3 bacterium TaxID=2052148 RepID=A0A7C1NG70_UNCW3|nr:branched-chain amino acid ABC transporter permease [candidate division WOR-3 bacterium]